MKRYLEYILFTSILVSITACNGNSRELTEEQIEISEELKTRFEGTEHLIYNGDTLLASDDVIAYYKKTDFEPIWTSKKKLNNRGKEMFDLVENARDHGLHPEMFSYTLLSQMKDTALLDCEMVLTNAFFLYTTHIDVGWLDPETYLYVWKKDSLDYDLSLELDKVRNGATPKDVITSHQPNFWEYKQLQAGLEKFLDDYPLDTNEFNIPPFKEDSVKCYKYAHEALIGHSFLDSSVTAQDSVFIEQLKVFQRINGLLDDAIVGKWTGKALNKSNRERFYSAAISLEKWRWKKPYPKKYIRVNVPEFTLYFVDSNVVKSKHRVVVGHPTTSTPEFHATMRRMVTNPFWHVPYSIASTEILYGAKKDSSYFSKRGYKVFKDGEQINPSTVDWSDVSQGGFRYKVRQDGGGGNSLGRIKFLFPNIHSVFIHDTPSKSLFGNDVRAYSHGCVRLQHPFELAKKMLIADGSDLHADTLDSYVRRGLQRVIELEDPFEVYIEYITSTGDSSGNVIFHPDIYGRDKKYVENSLKLFDKYGPDFFKHKPTPPAKTEEEIEVVEATQPSEE